MVGLGILPQAYDPYPPGNKGLEGIILYLFTNERWKTNGDCRMDLGDCYVELGSDMIARVFSHRSGYCA